VTAADHKFGGQWTRQKLECIGKYLSAYTTALKNQPFELLYIDAFAGTGSWKASGSEQRSEVLLPGVEDQEALEFARGSARIALEAKPAFAQYHFIEMKKERCADLEKLVAEYPDVHRSVTVACSEANEYIQGLCGPNGLDWRYRRAVMFLDPYGMQVDWSTIEAIAETKAIDLWLLFPLGSGVMRLLRGDGQISPGRRERLNRLLGSEDWYGEFYKQETTKDLFGTTTSVTKKEASFLDIQEFWLQRLNSVFPAVSKSPLHLYNSKKNPLYLLCFACGNERGAKVAMKIANHILRGMRNG